MHSAERHPIKVDTGSAFLFFKNRLTKLHRQLKTKWSCTMDVSLKRDTEQATWQCPVATRGIAEKISDGPKRHCFSVVHNTKKPLKRPIFFVMVFQIKNQNKTN